MYQFPENLIFIKVLVLGDKGCGKGTLLSVLKLITGCDQQNTDIKVVTNDLNINIQFTILSDLDEDKNLQDSSFFLYDTILLCYSIVQPASFQNLMKKWWPSVLPFKSPDQVVLIGNKKDLRGDLSTLHELAQYGLSPVKELDGYNFKEQIGASEYLECSALFNLGMNSIIRAIVFSYLAHQDL